jgi:hypothetical protein
MLNQSEYFMDSAGRIGGLFELVLKEGWGVSGDGFGFSWEGAAG